MHGDWKLESPDDALKLIEERLRATSLPPLSRPPVPPDADPTEELVLWGIRKYAYGLIAHYRTILGGVLLLSEAGNGAAVLVLARHLYEWTMQASYAYQQFEQQLRSGDLKSAWDLSSRISEGNSWIKEHGAKYVPEFPYEDTEDSIRIRHLAKAYKEYRRKEYGAEDVDSDYSYLSEHSHPNGACLMMYVDIRPPELRFIQQRYRGIPGILAATAIEWTVIMLKILGVAKDMVVGQQMGGLVRALAATAKPKG